MQTLRSSFPSLHETEHIQSVLPKTHCANCLQNAKHMHTVRAVIMRADHKVRRAHSKMHTKALGLLEIMASSKNKFRTIVPEKGNASSLQRCSFQCHL